MLFRSQFSSKRFARAGIFYLGISAPLSGLLGLVYAIYGLVLHQVVCQDQYILFMSSYSAKWFGGNSIRYFGLRTPLSGFLGPVYAIQGLVPPLSGFLGPLYSIQVCVLHQAVFQDQYILLRSSYSTKWFARAGICYLCLSTPAALFSMARTFYLCLSTLASGFTCPLQDISVLVLYQAVTPSMSQYSDKWLARTSI